MKRRSVSGAKGYAEGILAASKLLAAHAESLLTREESVEPWAWLAAVCESAFGSPDEFRWPVHAELSRGWLSDEPPDKLSMFWRQPGTGTTLRIEVAPASGRTRILIQGTDGAQWGGDEETLTPADIVYGAAPLVESFVSRFGWKARGAA